MYIRGDNLKIRYAQMNITSDSKSETQ